MLAHQFLRNDGVGSAQNIRFAETEHFFSARIPRSDQPIEIEANDGQRSGHEQGTETFVATADCQLACGSCEGNDVSCGGNEHDGRPDGRNCGKNLDRGGKPVKRLPDGQNFQKMCYATTDDEETEGPEKTLVREVLPRTAKNTNQGRGDNHIGQTDQKIADHCGPQKAAISSETVPMGKKVCGQKRSGREPQETSAKKQQQQEQPDNTRPRGKRESYRWRKRFVHEKTVLIYARRKNLVICRSICTAALIIEGELFRETRETKVNQRFGRE